jgi:nitrogen regulatory protein P-II 1
MKLIIAIIQPYKLEEVKEELYKAEVNLLTASEVLGHGRQKGVTEVYRGAK